MVKGKELVQNVFTQDIRIYFRRRMSANHWWCMDCRTAVELDKHGRCGSCESEAVDQVAGNDNLNTVSLCT
jgi:Zn finger protein HypA/HybF involved in hydrogenase expression